MFVVRLSEEERQKAHVYMEGLAEMRREWARTKVKGQRAEVKGSSQGRGRK